MSNPRLVLDTDFVTLNEYIKAERAKNKRAGSGVKDRETNKAAFLARRAKFKVDDNTLYDVKFTWIKPNDRHDHDNISFAKKFIFDGLIKAKSIQSDSPEYINNFQDVFILDRSLKNRICIIEFIEVDNLDNKKAT